MKQYPHPLRHLASGLLLGSALFGLQPLVAQTNTSVKPDSGRQAVEGYDDERPAIKSTTSDQERSPEALLQAEPSAAGLRAAQRQAVIRELQRARQRGEMDWQDRESTGYLR